ncbi:unnamed protein product [Moneuplotes crassus]|uniref:CBS domain-containing protein n=1 Tax=Euplotes crassus TaxID=5936 RepID=A0AAD1YCW0_EUPCR|nr:unnamed protein product [Moneuplotes crassus]
MRMPEKTILQEMFSQTPLNEQDRSHWDRPSILINLACFFFLKFILIILAVSLPIPSGVFTPSLLLGAVFGRFFGYILRLIFGEIIHETTYALVGATAMTASVTRTLSVAIIVFEINGELSYMIPVLIGVIISYAISNALGNSIFDTLLDLKDLPYLPTIRTECFKLKAEDIMKVNFDYLRIDSKISDLNGLISAQQRMIPVINKEGCLAFSIDIQYLRKYLINYYQMNQHCFSYSVRDTLNIYFNYIRSINRDKNDDFEFIQNSTEESNVIKKNIFGTKTNDYIPVQIKRKNTHLHIREYAEGEEQESEEYDPEASDPDESILQSFWNAPIDWEDQIIKVDSAPFIVLPDTKIEKIVFLYSILNVIKIFVVKDGHLIGTITKKELLKEHYDRHNMNDLQNNLLEPGHQYPTAVGKKED